MAKGVLFSNNIDIVCKQFKIEIGKIIFCIVVLIGLIILMFCNIFIETLLSLSIALVLFIANQILNLIKSIHKIKNEESERLDRDYESIIMKYHGDIPNMFVIENKSSLKKPKTTCTEVVNDGLKQKDVYRFPVICTDKNILSKYTFDYKKGDYQLDETLRLRKSEILQSLHSSKSYNRITQRIKSVTEVEDNTYNVKLEKSNYFNMLVTNRAIDYNLHGYGTVRDNFEEGPFISSLNDSKLSNHFGYNIIVETNDKNYVFLKRSSVVNLGKNGFGVGAAAALKLILEDKEQYTNDELKLLINKCVNQEIEDELGIINDSMNYNFNFDKDCIAFYRDLTEGGKPQFLFYIKLNINKQEFIEKHKVYFKNKKENTGKKSIRNFKYYTEAEVLDAYVTPDSIKIGNDKFSAVPSYSVSLAIYIKHFNQIKNR